MNRTIVVLGFAVLLSVSVLWAGGIGLVSYRHWHDTHTRIERKRDAGKQDCTTRYLEEDAEFRCMHLFDTQYIIELNIAKATRVLIAAGPLITLLIAALIGWQSARSRTRALALRARSTARRRAHRAPPEHETDPT